MFGVREEEDKLIALIKSHPEYRKHVSGVLVALLFVGIGVNLLVGSHAATSTVSLEAEGGTLSGNASQIADSTASGGAAVQFGAPTSTPTPTPTPTPTQPPGGGAYRAFTANSYWNTPMPANAPIDPNSAAWIAANSKIDPATGKPNSQNYLNLVIGGSYSQPIWFASPSDPITTIAVDTGGTVQVHIPSNAYAASGNDAQMVVFDRTAGFNRVVGIHHATKTSGQWKGDGADTYQLDGNGLDKRVGGDAQSGGHRGINGAVRSVRADEIQAGAINHRFECFWYATADAQFWPMAGHEHNKGGVVPEGAVIRIKPSVNLSGKGLNRAALILATALQKYGCLVGDNSGSGNNLKVQLNANWSGILAKDSLKNIPWSDWEFIKGGYDPVTNTVK